MKIKVLQLNIWRGEVLDNAITFFKEQDADILTLQEVYDGKDKSLPKTHRLYEYLQEVFPHYNAVYGAQLCDITEYGNIEEGTAAFSKFPLQKESVTFFDIPYKTFNNNVKTRFDDVPQSILHAKAYAAGKELDVFSVHGIWGFDGKDNPRRLKMADTILSKVEGCEYVIMGGDFNLSPNTETIAKITNKLDSVFGTSLISTFNMKHKKLSGYATAAVDMIFVSKNIKVLEKYCPQVDVSDHLPLVSTLEL